MSERLSFGSGIVIACAIALCAIGLAEHATAQVQCQSPSVAITDATRAAATAAGFPANAPCWDPNSPYVGQATAQAKQELQSMVCNSGVNIQNLDANFAVCADKFMTALRQVNPSACIESGYRNNSDQLKACMQICGASSCPGKCAAPGLSFHQKGLAIDVSHISNNQQAWQIAISSTGGGVANPPGLHSSDPDHFQASGSSCSGAPVPPNDTTDVYTGTQTGPTQSISAPQASLSPQQTAQPAPVAQPAAQPIQTPQQTAATTPTATPISQLNALTATTSSSSAASALLSSLLQPAPSTLFSTATSATQALNIMTNLGSVGTSASAFLNTTILNNIIPGDATTTVQATTSNTQEISYLQATFTSNPGQYTPGYTSPLDQILQPLKNALLALLAYLRSL
jgi:hypothetical protein